MAKKRNRDYAKEYQARIERAKNKGEKMGLKGETLENYAKSAGRGYHPSEVRTARNEEQVARSVRIQEFKAEAKGKRKDLLEAAVANAKAEGRQVTRDKLRREIDKLLVADREYVDAWIKFRKSLPATISAKDLAQRQLEFNRVHQKLRKKAYEARMRLSHLTGNLSDVNVRIWRDTP